MGDVQLDIRTDPGREGESRRNRAVKISQTVADGAEEGCRM